MAIVVVQAANAGQGNVATTNQTAVFGSNVTAGNAIIAAGTWAYNTTRTALSGDVTDAGSDTFTVLTQVNDTVNTQILALYYTPSSTGGFKNVTLNSAGMAGVFGVGFDGIVVLEVSGLGATSSDTGNTHDAHAGGSLATNGDTAGSFTPTANGDLIIAVFDSESGGSLASTWSAGTSPVAYTIPTNGQFNSAGQVIAIEYAVQTTAVAVNPTITYSATDGYIAIGWSFKAPAGAAVWIPATPWPQLAPILAQ